MLSRLIPRPRFALALLAIATLGFAILFAGNATKAPADFLDNTDCWGTIDKGAPDPDDADAIGVKYTFQCTGPITGYSLLTAPERQVVGTETEVFVTDGDKKVVPTDSFSCNGTFPGYGINCVSPADGHYRTPGNFVSGEFFVDRKLCAQPRLDPILYVAYASLNSAGKVVQALAGPFDLGHALSCPKPKHYKKHTRRKIPVEQDTVLTGQEERRRK